MLKNKNAFVLILVFLIMVFISIPALAETQNEDETLRPIKARVLKALSIDDQKIDYSGGSMIDVVQTLEVRILEGELRERIVEVEYILNYGFSDKYKSKELQKGDEVYIIIETDEDGNIVNTFVSEISRGKPLLYLLAAFILVLLITGGFKGFKTIITLGITVLVIVKVMFPLLLKGYSPIIVSIGVCMIIIGITIPIISGPNKKTLAAVIGTTGGVLAAGLIAFITGGAAKLTGLGSEESMMLMYIPHDIKFDFQGLLFAGIIIGAMGAAMDVGMSIASSMYEIRKMNSSIKFYQLWKAGMNVGKDVMATMSNTLILAYTGGAIQLVLLIMAYDIPFGEMINRDIIASEVVRALSGSIGLILTIPVTALVAGFLYIKRKAFDNDDRVPVDYRS